LATGYETRATRRNPPRLAALLLSWVSWPGNRLSILGDYEELYHAIVLERGLLAARAWYWRQVLKSVPMFLTSQLLWSVSVLRNFLVVALRNVRRNKVYSFVNIAGLAVGMACFTLISLYVRNELSYDWFHRDADRIFRITKEWMFDGKLVQSSLTPNPLGPEISRTCPQIAAAVRILAGGADKKLVRYEDRTFEEETFFLVDPSFFDVFTFPLLQGDPGTALTDPWSLVITEAVAHKYFGHGNPVGKVIRFQEKYDFTITGMMKDVPENSHFQSGFFGSIGCADAVNWKGFLEDWTQSSVITYVRIKAGPASQDLEKELTGFATRQGLTSPEAVGSTGVVLRLQPLTRIHLYSHLNPELQKNGDIRYVYFYSLIALVILFVACANSMTITSSQALTRHREVGLRKVIGARRFHLVIQFLCESVVSAFIALPLSLVLVKLAFAPFRNLVGVDLKFLKAGPPSVCLLSGMAVLVGLASGSYPALILAGHHPARIFKGVAGERHKGNRVRNTLVTGQFIISICLLTCTLVIDAQVRYLHTKDLGFNKDNILAVRVPSDDEALKSRFESIKNELRRSPDILGVTATSNLPHKNFAAKRIPVGDPTEGRRLLLNFMRVDEDFVDTMRARILEGRNFSKDIPSDSQAFIVNEAAAEQFGFRDPVGQHVPWIGGEWPVIGVIKNFHFKPLYEKIEPIVLYLQQGGSVDHILVKIREGTARSATGFIQKTMASFDPGRIFEVFFLDEDIDRTYRAENTFMRIFFWSSGLAVFIATLGLFGLASFSVRQRTKEISIRKVLGASASGLVILLSKDTLKLILLASATAAPLSFILMRRWLERFAYRIPLSVFVFALSALLGILVAALTTGFQALKAAHSSPAQVLKSE
jgi:putative ABC transport system permease protein